MDPITVFVPRCLGLDLLRDDVLNMHIRGPQNLKFGVIAVLSQLDTLQTVTRPIQEISTEVRLGKRLFKTFVRWAQLRVFLTGLSYRVQHVHAAESCKQRLSFVRTLSAHVPSQDKALRHGKNLTQLFLRALP